MTAFLLLASLRFLSFNIWGDFFGNPPHERDRIEAGIVRKWHPDIAGFQEVTKNFWKSRLFSDLADEYEVIGRGLGPGEPPIDAFSPLIYLRSRFELVDSGADWYCPEIDPSKGVVWAILRDRESGRNLAVFSSHFWWRYDGKGDDWIRLYSAQRLRERMFALAKRHDAAIIGGGDLNAALESTAMQYLVTHGLADAQDTARVSPRGYPTDHGDPKRDAAGVYRGVPAGEAVGLRPEEMHLDHVFYDPERIVADRFSIDTTPEACGVSDHHPIVTDFVIIQKH